MFEQMSKLRAMNEKLRAARDLLLPRLMSGRLQSRSNCIRFPLNGLINHLEEI